MVGVSSGSRRRVKGTYCRFEGQCPPVPNADESPIVGLTTITDKKKAKEAFLFVKFYTLPKAGLIFTQALLPSAISKCELSSPGSSVPAFEVVLQ